MAGRLRWTFDYPSPPGKEELRLGYARDEGSFSWQELLHSAATSAGRLDLAERSELRLWDNDLFAVLRERVDGPPVLIC